MPMATPRACEQPGCPNPAIPGTWRCEQHKNAHSEQRDPFYKTAQWMNLRKYLLACGHDTFCSYVDELGVRCREKSAILHHILDKKEYSAFQLDWRNLVWVCRVHNPHEGGAPSGAKYMPTPYKIPGGDIVPTFYVSPGERVIGVDVHKLWTLDNRKAELLGIRGTRTDNMPPPLPPLPAPPASLPVAPEHAHYPDGTEATKAEYNRQYRKQGDSWLLVA